MSITAIVENDTIKLPLHVPDGTRVEITLAEGNTAARRSGLHADAWDVAADFDVPLPDEFWLGRQA